MNKKLLALLVCPICKGKLEFKDKELICHQDKLAFPVKKGIPILLESDARKITLTE